MAFRASDVEVPSSRSFPGRSINVAPTERVLSVLGGSALTLYGLNRRAWSSVPLAVAGLALLYRGARGHSRLYERAGINTARPAETALDITSSMTIKRPPEEVYGFWRNLENLPRLFPHLRSVAPVGDARYHVVAQLPAMSEPVEWDVEVIEDRPNELLRWRSAPDSPLHMAGTVRFTPAPGGRGTEVHVTMEHRPESALRAVLAKAAQPISAQMLKEGIRHAKQLLEAGVIPTIEGQPDARAA